MAKCAYCGRRKAKRPCPVLTDICTLCCGRQRGGGIDCPSDCVHLPVPAAEEAAVLAPALRKLDAFAKEEDARRSRDAVDALLGEVREVEEWELPLLLAWIAHGYDSPGAGRALDRFLARHGRSLEPAERRALEAMRDARASLYRIREVISEGGLHLTDLRTEEEIFVRERRGTRDAAAGDLLLSWIVDLGGQVVLTGASARVAPGHVPAMLEAARREESAGGVALALHQTLRGSLRASLGARLGALVESIVFARAEYEIDDRERVLRRISSRADFLPEGEERFRLAPDDEQASGPAWVRIRRVGLSLAALTREGFAAGKARLERALGPLVRHRFDRVEEAGSMTVPEAEERLLTLLGGEEEEPAKDGPRPISILPREELFREIDGLWPAVRDAAADLRSRIPAGGVPGSFEAEEIFAVPAVERFLERKVSDRRLERRSRQFISVELQNLAAHLFWLVNHELNRRKTFRVDDDLAFALSQTSLDIAGEELRLPFPSAAFVFTDRSTLDLAENLLAAEPTSRLSGRRLRVLYGVVVEGRRREEDRAVPFFVTVLFSAGGAGEPYMLQRQLYVLPEDRLEAILESHFPDVVESEIDDVFRVPETKALLHLLLNAVLYATSADVKTVRLPARKRGRRAGGGGSDRESDAPPDDVFYLPGRISISKVRHLRDLEATESGRRIMVRFLVRGHWRRANPNWKDQRLRWIEPFWKGPDLATVVEREYRLKS